MNPPCRHATQLSLFRDPCAACKRELADRLDIRAFPPLKGSARQRAYGAACRAQRLLAWEGDLGHFAPGGSPLRRPLRNIIRRAARNNAAAWWISKRAYSLSNIAYELATPAEFEKLR